MKEIKTILINRNNETVNKDTVYDSFRTRNMIFLKEIFLYDKEIYDDGLTNRIEIIEYQKITGLSVIFRGYFVIFLEFRRKRNDGQTVIFIRHFVY